MTEDYGLDQHCKTLLAEYHEQLPHFEQLQRVVMEQLDQMMKQSDIELNSMESRIKGEASLAGKLRRKGNKYAQITDITDILGVRIIAFYNEDVDRIAAMAEQLFDVDWPNSVDKRTMHQFDSFGYNSLHYICKLPKSIANELGHPELCDLAFELQMRTALQHVWSAIQHDIGYKSEIETPLEYHRNLSRLAGMLELADNEFSRIRTAIADYRRRARKLVKSGHLDEVTLDADTFGSYLELHPFRELNQRIASITQAELTPAPAMPYLGVLRQMELRTLADVEHLINQYSEDAYQLALFQLGSTDIDILADTVGLQNLCVVYILKNGGGKVGLRHMLDRVNGPLDSNDVMAQILVDQAQRLSFMNP